MSKRKMAGEDVHVSWDRQKHSDADRGGGRLERSVLFGIRLSSQNVRTFANAASHVEVN